MHGAKSRQHTYLGGSFTQKPMSIYVGSIPAGVSSDIMLRFRNDFNPPSFLGEVISVIR
jgi:hypothetical protein